jgi:hypothetical protein
MNSQCGDDLVMLILSCSTNLVFNFEYERDVQGVTREFMEMQRSCLSFVMEMMHIIDR